MFDFSKMEIGDSCFVVNETNNAFSRKKIYNTDHDGIEWFRYDKELRDYEIVNIVLIGTVEPNVKGQIPEEDKNELTTSYFFDNGDGTQFWNNQNYYCSEDHFATREEAAAEVSIRQVRFL